LIGEDDRFELVPKRQLSLLNFRLKPSKEENNEENEERNKKLVAELCKDGRLFVVAGKVCDMYFIRVSVPSNGDEKDYDFLYKRMIEVCNEFKIW